MNHKSLVCNKYVSTQICVTIPASATRYDKSQCHYIISMLVYKCMRVAPYYAYQIGMC